MDNPLTPDGALHVSQGRPMSECAHGQQPANYDGPGQDLYSVDHRRLAMTWITELSILSLTGITDDNIPESRQV